MPIRLIADARAAGTPYARHWNVCVGAGRANEGLRAAWLEHLKLAIEHCGFRYVRFHGLFHDDMFVYPPEVPLTVPGLSNRARRPKKRSRSASPKSVEWGHV